MSRGHARSRSHPGRRRLAAAAAWTAGALAVATALPAAAATDPPPAPGLAAGAASVGGGAPETAVDLFYRTGQRLVQKNGTGVTDLGGVLTSGVAAISASPGGTVRKTVAVRGADDAVWLRTWTPASGWQAWRTIGGKSLGTPGLTCVGEGAGDPVVYVRGLDRALWRHAGAWTKIGGTPASDPGGLAAVGSDCPDGEHVFSVSTDGYLWEWAQATGWRRVGGRSSVAPSATLLPDGSTDLFARAPDDAAWVAHRPAGATAFEPFQKIGGGTFTSAVTGFVDTTEPADRLVLGVGTGNSLIVASDELGGDPAWVWGEVP